MTIQELADRAEVTTRTVRYYVEQGVLPPPERGRPAEYTEEHVARLALIKRLKEQYLPLEEIRDTMQRLSLPEVEVLVSGYSPQQEQRQKLDSAADYIANVLGRGAVREQMKQQSTTEVRRKLRESAPAKVAAPGSTVPLERAASVAPASYAEPLPAAAPTDAQAAKAPVPPPAQAATPEGASVSAPPPPPGSPASSLASRLWSSVVGRRSSPEGAATASEEGAYMLPSTSWQRVQLGEGIELHYLASDDAHFNNMVARLIDAAHHILDEGPGNGE